jgi:hypothetical protein
MASPAVIPYVMVHILDNSFRLLDIDPGYHVHQTPNIMWRADSAVWRAVARGHADLDMKHGFQFCGDGTDR